VVTSWRRGISAVAKTRLERGGSVVAAGIERCDGGAMTDA